MDPIVIGIDVSKDKLDIAIRPCGEVFATSRDAAGLDALIARLVPLSPMAVAVEATGGFETVVAASLASAGLPVVVVNPAQVRAFAQAPFDLDVSIDRHRCKRAKTDPIDAMVIARFAEATKPEIRPLPDTATRLLSDLLARRRQIIEMIVAERQRQRRFDDAHLLKSIARLVKALEKELAALDRDIDDAVRGSPAWREKEDLLASVPGVGPVVARTLIAELPELGRLGRKEIAALAGLAPWTRQSGRWKGKSFIGGGRACVRAALFMGAVHGRSLRGAAQSGARGLQTTLDRGRQTEARRDHRGGAQAVDHPRCRAARQKTVERRRTGAGSCPTFDLMASRGLHRLDGSRPRAAPAGARTRSP